MKKINFNSFRNENETENNQTALPFLKDKQNNNTRASLMNQSFQAPANQDGDKVIDPKFSGEIIGGYSTDDAQTIITNNSKFSLPSHVVNTKNKF